MRNAVLLSLVLLSLALLGPALPSLAQARDTPPAGAAQQAVGCPGPGPVSDEVRAWQHKELGKFSQVSFFDTDGKPMPAEAFLRDVTCHVHAFEMKQSFPKDAPPTIELRMLRDGGGGATAFPSQPKR